ncbi:MAG: AmmeMemoRadiSam system protein A [Candidatus Aenigmatarchaeota archaeon]
MDATRFTKYKEFLLSLARKSIEYFLEKRELMHVNEEELDNELKEKRPVFVTLEKHGMLRGCIGNLQPTEPLYAGVIKNAVAAAFYDVRFYPLSRDELDEVTIEISILSEPKKIEYKTVKELLRKIRRFKDGLIIRCGHRTATFLPQVWEKLPEKELFLSELCLKAGLKADEWKKGSLEVFKYNVICFKEKG